MVANHHQVGALSENGPVRRNRDGKALSVYPLSEVTTSHLSELWGLELPDRFMTGGGERIGLRVGTGAGGDILITVSVSSRPESG
jgi:hypothetical protein